MTKKDVKGIWAVAASFTGIALVPIAAAIVSGNDIGETLARWGIGQTKAEEAAAWEAMRNGEPKSYWEF